MGDRRQHLEDQRADPRGRSRKREAARVRRGSRASPLGLRTLRKPGQLLEPAGLAVSPPGSLYRSQDP